jgi:hypothetical protein
MTIRQMYGPIFEMSGLVAEPVIMGSLACWYLGPAAKVAPLNMWPLTNSNSLSPMNFWATSTASLGSPRSSPITYEAVPPFTFAVFSSSIAMSAPAFCAAP